MAKKAKAKPKTTEELLQDLLIIHLLKEGVGNHDIRAFLGIDYKRVTTLAQLLNKGKGMPNANSQ